MHGTRCVVGCTWAWWGKRGMYRAFRYWASIGRLISHSMGWMAPVRDARDQLLRAESCYRAAAASIMLDCTPRGS